MGKRFAILGRKRQFLGRRLQPAERLRIDVVLLQQTAELAPLFAGGDCGVRDVSVVLVHHALEVAPFERRDRFLLQRMERPAVPRFRQCEVDRKSEISS